MFFNLGKGFSTLGLRLRDIWMINMNSEWSTWIRKSRVESFESKSTINNSWTPTTWAKQLNKSSGIYLSTLGYSTLLQGVTDEFGTIQRCCWFHTDSQTSVLCFRSHARAVLERGPGGIARNSPASPWPKSDWGVQVHDGGAATWVQRAKGPNHVPKGVRLHHRRRWVCRLCSCQQAYGGTHLKRTDIGLFLGRKITHNPPPPIFLR